jgi:DNA-binding NarL/FixJ family response regulator
MVPEGDGEGLRFGLVGGEAGSGKSRLVREFARQAVDSGAGVLYGACDSVVRRPYGPFVEALEQYVRTADPTRLRADLGSEGGELSRLLPELTQLVGELPVSSASDPDTERHRLHSVVADLLASVSQRAPLVLIIEDVHWADTPTLLLLRHLARASTDARALVVTTFRDTEAEVPDALAATLAELRRSEGVVRVRLGGLSAEEISEFVRHAGGENLGANVPEIGRLLHGLTGGNAFLVTQLWRSLLEAETVLVEGTGAALTRAVGGLGSPEGVREVVSQRLARLNAPATRLLELAAVAGPQFDLELVAASGLTDAELRGALQEAEAHGMIEEVAARRLTYRFTHELVRRALYDRMPGLRRAELHLAVGEALERVSDPDQTQRLAELAHHFGAAAPLDGPQRPIEYALLAGRAALKTLDFDEAAGQFSTALELGIDDPRRRAAIYLELGSTRFRGGRSGDAMEAYLAVLEIARQLGDAQLLATAAIGYEDACWRPALSDEGVVELLHEASVALGDGDSELRVRLLSGLTRAYALAGDSEAAIDVESQAVAMARRLDDRIGLATVLMRSYWSHHNAGHEQTLSMLSEARDLAEAMGETDLQTEAMEWRIASLIGLGDLRSADQELKVVQALAARMRQPFILHVAEHYAATLALCAGHLDEAEAAARRSHEWSRLLTGRPPSGVYGIQMFGIRREQGRLAELAPAIQAFVASEEADSAWRPGLAALLAELGLEAEARHQLRLVREQEFEPLRSSLWLASLTYLVDACGLLGDAELAALLYPELAPLTGGVVAVGHGVACYGAADRYLGVLAATMGDHARAIEHFERATTRNREIGAITWLAHTLYGHGRALTTRGRGEDVARASALLSEAIQLAQQIGMPSLLARAERVQTGGDQITALPDELSAREVEILRLVAAGHSNREIGQRLYISSHTVANHIRSILRKTGAANRTEAAGYAFRHALLDAPESR